MPKIKTIKLPESSLKWINIKVERASDMSIEDMGTLVNWCGWQDGNLWEDMSLQEILNVYRISAEWDTWEGWAEDEWPAAHKAWNKAVIDPGNKMEARRG